MAVFAATTYTYRMMRALTIVGLSWISSSAVNAAPWQTQCEVTLKPATLALKKVGKVSVVVSTPQPLLATSGQANYADPFGTIALTVVDPGGWTYTATIAPDQTTALHGTDPSGGIHYAKIQYQRWHSPYDDTLNEDPMAANAKSMRAEYHQRLAASVLLAEWHVQPTKVKTSHAAQVEVFAATMQPLLAACIADVLPEQADPSLPWTDPCFKELAAAHTALVKANPAFAAGTCTRAPFAVNCGNIAGAPPTWNASTMLSGDPHAATTWRDDGVNRIRYAGGYGLIWGSSGLTASAVAQLQAAFKLPLARCVEHMRAAMIVP